MLGVTGTVLVPAVILAGLTGCTIGEPGGQDSDSQAGASGTMSPDEQLEKAKVAVATSDLVLGGLLSDPARDPAELKPLFTDSGYAEQLAGLTTVRATGRRLEGMGRIVDYHVIKNDAAAGVIQLVVCADVSGTRVLDGDGADVTPTDREPVQAMDAQLERAEDELKLAHYVAWNGRNPC